MTGRFRRTNEAKEDLLQIWSFIADADPAAATKMLLKLDRAMTKLARNPGIGRNRPELTPGLKSYACRPYVIFYTAIKSDIDIVRVLHGARDIENLFSGSR
jgi:toxin ParE1/3/4